MEPRMVKAESDQNPSSTYGMRLLPDRNIRGGNDVADTDAAYDRLPERIKRTGGVNVLENPKQPRFDASEAPSDGASKPWKPRGRK